MKLVKILLTSFCIIILLTTNIFALGEILDTGSDWETDGKKNTGYTMDTEYLSEKANNIYNLFLAVATAVAVIVGAILGITYMTAGINKKVEVKESLFPYFVSCIVVFGSFGIWKLVVTIMSKV